MFTCANFSGSYEHYKTHWGGGGGRKMVYALSLSLSVYQSFSQHA